MTTNKKHLLPIQGEIVQNTFQKSNIKKLYHKEEWWFVLEDIIASLTETKNPKDYIKKIRSRDEGIKEGWGQIVTPLPISTTGGIQKKNCINIEGILRIIQSIPSKRVEPFKRWLAKSGFERIKETQNPELSIQRAILNYQIQGRNEKWINDRVKAILTRNELTKEWKNRNVKKNTEYGILTDEISRGTFGINTKQHKEIKELKKNHNLRDNMSSIELIFQRLGEEATIEVTKEKDSKGFKENLKSAKIGGQSAGEARLAFEKRIDKKVVTSSNHLKNKKPDLVKIDK